MKRFLQFTDVHVSDIPPAMRTESYPEDIFLKLEEIAQACSRYKIDLAIFTGDWFHLKAAARTSHSLVNRSLQMIERFPCDVLMLPGNHDIPYNRLDLLDKRPFGTLLKSHKVTALMDEPLDVENDGLTLRFIPIPGITVETTDTVLKKIAAMRGDKMFNIVLMHQPVMPSGTYPYNVIKAGDLVGSADMIIYGHVHVYHGTYSQALDGKSTIFSNVGAVSRGSLTEDEIAREPRYLVFAVDPQVKTKDYVGPMVKYEEVKLKNVKPATEVFRIADKAEQKQKELDIDEFLNSIATTKFGLFTKEAAIEKIRNMPNVSDSVKDKAVELLTNV